MSEILPFRSVASERKRGAARVPCEIVFFTGVRVEYHERRAPAEPAARSQTRRRRTTEADLAS